MKNDKSTRCLNAAATAVQAHAMSYGPQDVTFKRIAELWTAMGLKCDNGPVTAQDVVIAMVLLKVARQMHASNADNWVDMAGYAACGAEVDDKG